MSAKQCDTCAYSAYNVCGYVEGPVDECNLVSIVRTLLEERAEVFTCPFFRERIGIRKH